MTEKLWETSKRRRVVGYIAALLLLAGAVTWAVLLPNSHVCPTGSGGGTCQSVVQDHAGLRVLIVLVGVVAAVIAALVGRVKFEFPP